MGDDNKARCSKVCTIMDYFLGRGRGEEGERTENIMPHHSVLVLTAS